MKKIKLIAFGFALSLGMSSCVVDQVHSVTGNPIGTKVGVAKGTMFMNPNFDISMQAAAKNGGINKIGSVEIKTTIFIIPFYKTTVTGE